MFGSFEDFANFLEFSLKLATTDNWKKLLKEGLLMDGSSLT